MSKVRVQLFLCLILCLFPVVTSALYEGQGMEEVSAELGEPNGKRSLADGEVWVYSGDITLEFSAGKLTRAKGLMLEPAPEVFDPEHEDLAPEQVGDAEPVRKTPAPVPAEAASGGDSLDKEIQQFSEGIPELPSDFAGLAEEGEEDIRDSRSFLSAVLSWAIPVFLGFIFLLIAFKIVGTEASKSALLFIAVADQAVMHGVRWFFLELLGFPSALHADALASFIVMLILVNKMTYAKQLPVAIRIVVISKVAGLVAWYFLLLFVLHNL